MHAEKITPQKSIIRREDHPSPHRPSNGQACPCKEFGRGQESPESAIPDIVHQEAIFPSVVIPAGRQRDPSSFLHPTETGKNRKEELTPNASIDDGEGMKA